MSHRNFDQALEGAQIDLEDTKVVAAKSDFFDDWFPEPGCPMNYKSVEDFHNGIAEQRSRSTPDLIDSLKSEVENADPWEIDTPLMLAVAERLADLECGKADDG